MSELYRQLFTGHIGKLYSQAAMKGADGTMHPVDMMTAIPPAGVAVLWKLVTGLRPNRTLETGCAYGVSSLAIAGALESNGKGHHTAIDPFQNSIWKGIGMENVRSLGLASRFRCIMEPSGLAMAKALANNERYEMIFIDGDHLYDGVMIDIYYANRLLVDGGIMVLDDAPMRSVRAACSWVETNLPFTRLKVDLPFYTMNEQSGGVPDSPAQRFAVFRKEQADDRAWTHFQPFDGGGR